MPGFPNGQQRLFCSTVWVRILIRNTFTLTDHFVMAKFVFSTIYYISRISTKCTNDDHEFTTTRILPERLGKSKDSDQWTVGG